MGNNSQLIKYNIYTRLLLCPALTCPAPIWRKLWQPNAVPLGRHQASHLEKWERGTGHEGVMEVAEKNLVSLLMPVNRIFKSRIAKLLLYLESSMFDLRRLQ